MSPVSLTVRRRAVGLAWALVKVAQTDTPTPADYDGDGKADVAVFRNGTWYINRITGGFLGVQFGTSEDMPVESIFVR